MKIIETYIVALGHDGYSKLHLTENNGFFLEYYGAIDAEWKIKPISEDRANEFLKRAGSFSK